MILQYYRAGAIKLLSVSVLVLGLGSVMASPHLYRYKDADDKTVLSRTVPPEFVAKGYEVLNEKGRVIEKVAPALTPEQIAQRDADLAQQKEEEAKKLEQARADAELKQLYSHPDDAVRIMERKATDILNLMQAKQSKIEFSQKGIVEIEQKAAELQRKGLSVPSRFDAQLVALRKDIENSQADLVERSESFDVLIREFDTKVKRLEIITRKKSVNYDSVLEKLNQIKQSVKLDK